MLRTTISRQIRTGARFSHSLSNATVGNLDKRWEQMTPTDQQELVSLLGERQKLPWSELSPAEKKAAWYVSYGAWGPRRPVLKEGDGMKIFGGVLVGLIAAVGIFAAVRSAAAPPPRTLNREWQEASDEYLKSKNAEPFTGYSQIQSK